METEQITFILCVNIPKDLIPGRLQHFQKVLEEKLSDEIFVQSRGNCKPKVEGDWELGDIIY